MLDFFNIHFHSHFLKKNLFLNKFTCYTKGQQMNRIRHKAERATGIRVFIDLFFRRYMAGILLIRRKTRYNQSIISDLRCISIIKVLLGAFINASH